ncbi:DnaA regulatory inactivator HdaA [Mesorhizobium sp. CAU 1741]|uniref:DnaA regulatory inactivator HdaA n=1 Tax=Mesorhizobium sp. CAU 1741 TaxID=3140366 RepID=UPI00325AB7F0
MSSGPANTPRQLPLDLVHPVARSRDDLVVAPANAEALALIERWPDWPTPVMVLAGPAGSGKSHLAAIWCSESSASRFSAGPLGSAAIEAAAHGPVLIDDIDARPVDEIGLFHLINAVRQAGTSLLLTSRRFPSAWSVRLPDLASRLKAAAIVEIQEPDDVLLAAVLTKLFADRQVEVEPHVVHYLVRRMERSLSTAIDVVARLDRAALEQKTRITRALAAQVLTAMDAGQQRLDF